MLASFCRVVPYHWLEHDAKSVILELCNDEGAQKARVAQTG